MSESGPESAKGWLQTFLTIAREGGPVSLLIACGASALIVWVLVGEMSHLREEKTALYQQLLEEHKAHIALAASCTPQK